MNCFNFGNMMRSTFFIIFAALLFFPGDKLAEKNVIELNPNKPKKEIIAENFVTAQELSGDKWILTITNFGLQNSKFSPESYPIISEVIAAMLKNPNMTVDIRGYTDNIGAANYNDALSQKRADIVRDYLISNGIPAERLTAVGFGENDPVGDNNESKGRAANNRIEICVVSGFEADRETVSNKINTAELIPKENVKPEVAANIDAEPNQTDAKETVSNKISASELKPKENVKPEATTNIDKEQDRTNTNKTDKIQPEEDKQVVQQIYSSETNEVISADQNIYNSGEVKLKAPLKQNWSYKANGVILNQQIVGAVCYINTVNGISAISLIDGKELWNYSYPPGPAIPSVVTFSQRYAAFITYEYFPDEEKGKSKLYLVDLESGGEKWIAVSENTWYKPVPLLNDQFVFIVGGPPDDWNEPGKYFEMELDDAYLYCYSPDNGKEVWKSKLQDSKTELLSLSPDKIFLTFDFELEKDVLLNKLLCMDVKSGRKLWDYDPSGMFTKSSVGDVVSKDNKLFTRPIKSYLGVVAALQPEDGDELWSSYTGADNLYFLNNKVYSYANTDWMLGTRNSTTWHCVDIASGDNVFNKSIYENTQYSKIFAIMFANIGVVEVVLQSITNIGNLVSLFIPSGDSEAPAIIPTASLFTGLNNPSVLNDKGLFCVYNTDDNYVLNISKDNAEDESKTEFIFPEGIKDAFIANGTSPTNAFVTYAGKVSSINIASGKEEWTKDFDPNAVSLGLIIKGNKMYLFTLDKIIQLTSE